MAVTFDYEAARKLVRNVKDFSVGPTTLKDAVALLEQATDCALRECSRADQAETALATAQQEHRSTLMRVEGWLDQARGEASTHHGMVMFLSGELSRLRALPWWRWHRLRSMIREILNHA